MQLSRRPRDEPLDQCITDKGHTRCAGSERHEYVVHKVVDSKSKAGRQDKTRPDTSTPALLCKESKAV